MYKKISQLYLQTHSHKRNEKLYFNGGSEIIKFKAVRKI